MIGSSDQNYSSEGNQQGFLEPRRILRESLRNAQEMLRNPKKSLGNPQRSIGIPRKFCAFLADSIVGRQARPIFGSRVSIATKHGLNVQSNFKIGLTFRPRGDLQDFDQILFGWHNSGNRLDCSFRWLCKLLIPCACCFPNSPTTLRCSVGNVAKDCQGLTKDHCQVVGEQATLKSNVSRKCKLI